MLSTLHSFYAHEHSTSMQSMIVMQQFHLSVRLSHTRIVLQMNEAIIEQSALIKNILTLVFLRQSMY